MKIVSTITEGGSLTTIDGLAISEIDDEMLLALLSRTTRCVAYRWRKRELEDWRRKEIINILESIVQTLPDSEKINNEEEQYQVTI